MTKLLFYYTVCVHYVQCTCTLYKLYKYTNICACKPFKRLITYYMLLSYSRRYAFHHAKPYTVLYYTTLHYTTLHYTILYNTIPHYTILYYTTLHDTILYYTILYYTILLYTILHSIYYTTLYILYSLLCYTVLDSATIYTTLSTVTLKTIVHTYMFISSYPFLCTETCYHKQGRFFTLS